MAVIPSLSVAIQPPAGIIPLTEKSFQVSVEVRGDEQKGTQGHVRLELPQGWRSEPRSAEFSFSHAGETKMFSFLVTPGALAETAYKLKAVAETANGSTSEGFRAVGYKGLTPTNMYDSATYRARGVDVKIAPGLKVGYLPGTGDEVQASLENLGVHATTLTVADIAAGKLSGYDAVVLGVRAYSANPAWPRQTESCWSTRRTAAWSLCSTTRASSTSARTLFRWEARRRWSMRRLRSGCCCLTARS